MILKRTGVIQTSGLHPPAPEAGRKAGPSWAVLPPGLTLQDRYEILGVLGHGGMSTVYRARDRRFASVDRLVAVKEMFSATQDAAALRLRLATFEREANLLATLQHAAIPKIYDYFTHEGRIYLVLELIIGQNLETVLDLRRTISEKEVADWGIQVCDLLRYLHDHKPDPIIFRDIKPSNIMLRDDGRNLALVDFGIARTFQTNQRGTMIGTEGYAPPEQYRGLASQVGDIYALGATLHHLATGNDPRLETPFTFHQRPPRQLNPALSDAFETVVLKAVAYNGQHRYATAEEMREALIASQQRTPSRVKTTALPPPPPPVDEPPSGANDAPPVAPEAKRRTGMLETAALPAAPIAPAAPPRRTAGRVSTGSLGTQSVDIASRVAWSMRTGDEVRSSPTVAGEQVYIGSYDGNLYAVSRADGAVLWRAPGGRGICSTPAISSGLVIYGSEDHSVYAVARANGRRAWAYRTGLPVRSSPRVAGSHVYIGSDDGYLYCFELKTGTLTWRTRTWSHVRSTPLVLEGLVVVGSDDGYLYAIDRDTGSVYWRFQANGPILASPTAAGGLIVAGSIDGTVYAVRPESGERAWRLPTGRPVVAALAAHDEVGYVGSVSGYVYALRLEDGEVLWQYADPSQVTSTAAVDGQLIYYGSGDGHVRALNRADGTLRWQVKTGGPVPSSPTIADGVLYIGSTDRHLYALPLDAD
ncbi:MAG: PQQ-binding-like beta-propeller repeat protein [Chloroflexi bacterium]|nr:PQQ-binding-like beta-propeller repeat protein [Chloroflexota bacterium]